MAVKSHYAFTAARETKYTSQNCCEKTINGKMALYRKSCFPNYCTKSWWKKLLS